MNFSSNPCGIQGRVLTNETLSFGFQGVKKIKKALITSSIYRSFNLNFFRLQKKKLVQKVNGLMTANPIYLVPKL
jgi:hypothetical protein